MAVYFVLENPKSWKLNLPGVGVVTVTDLGIERRVVAQRCRLQMRRDPVARRHPSRAARRAARPSR